MGLRFRVLCVLAFLVTGAAGDEMRPHGISVVLDDNYPPYCFRDGDGRIQGILIDQWRLFETRTGTPVAIHGMDWGDALARMRAGTYDVIDTIFKTEERSRWLAFTPPYEDIEVAIFFDRAIAGITDAASLRGFPVAVKAGDAAIDLLTGRGVGNLIPFPSYEAIVLAAKERKVNVFVIDKPPAIHFLAKHGILDRFHVSAPLDTGAFHRAVRQGNDALLARLQEGFARITPADRQAIRTRWHGSSEYEGGYLRILAIVAGALVVVLVLLFVRNRTLRLSAARATRDREDFRKRIFDHSPIPIVVMDAGTHRYLDCNPAAVAIYSRATREEVLGRTPLDFSAPFQYDGSPSADKSAHYIGRALAEGSVVFEWLHQHPDGSRWDAEVHLLVFHVAGGRYLQFSLLDITERKRAEEELRNSQALLHGVIEGTDDSIFVKDAEGRCILHNEALRRFMETLLGPGFPSDGILGKRDRDYLPAAIAGRLEVDDAAIKSTGLPQSIEETFPFAGQPRTYQTRKFPFLLSADAGMGILGVARDITERTRSEAALRESEARFRAMFAGASEGILITDAATRRFRYANPAICRILGFSEAELLERRVDDIHPVADRPRLVDAFQRKVRGENIASIEAPVLCKDGSVRFCDIRSQIIEIQGAACLMGMFHDVTDERRVAERLRQAEKLQAVGQLAAGVAHDFNNMLAGILGTAELVERRLPADSPLRRHLAMIATSAGRAGELTAKLLAFSRRSTAEAVPVDLHRVLGDTIALLANTIDRRITIVQDLQAPHPCTIGDAVQLQNALLNLGINAVQAMPDGGTLTFATRLVTPSALPGLGGGPHCAIEIRDTGCGIPAEHLPRVFEPFFTTKAPGQGTGLGLAVAFGTVQQHHGLIEVQSTVGVGTCFRVLLPSTGHAAAAAPVVAAAPATGSGLILVVDDEAILRDMLAITLEDLGYRVLKAADGRQALDCFIARRTEIDLVILDQLMPEMNGRDCFIALRRIAPDLRVILVSGFIHEDDLARMRADGLCGYLGKPFHVEELARTVQEVLGRRAGPAL